MGIKAPDNRCPLTCCGENPAAGRDNRNAAGTGVRGMSAAGVIRLTVKRPTWPSPAVNGPGFSDGPVMPQVSN